MFYKFDNAVEATKNIFCAKGEGVVGAFNKFPDFFVKALANFHY